MLTQLKTILVKVKKIIFTVIKANVMFFLGMVFGSVVATITTILVTMGLFGLPQTLSLYHQAICGG